jgi:hypothetical protein
MPACWQSFRLSSNSPRRASRWRRRTRAIERKSGAALADKNRKATEAPHAFSIAREDRTPVT